MLVIAVAAAVGPHAWHLPAPVVGFFAVAAAYRLAAIVWPGLLPGRLLLAVLILAGLSTFVLGQGAMLNRD